MEKQEDAKGKCNKLPISVTQFIRFIIKKMRYRKKVGEEVEAELAAHFEDELKGCKSDTEREQTAKELVGGFGDVKMLAVLLRRAKKRCRPLWRTVVARAFQTVGVLFICLVLYIVWFLTGKPVVTRDYIAEFNNLVRPVADESLNAATLYNQAIEVFEDLPDDISDALGKRYYEATQEDKQLIGKWLTDNDEVFELVIAGSQKPYYWQHYEGEEMLSVLLPHLSKYRRLAFSLRWRSRLHAENGRYEEAFNDIKTCYRFGRHVKGTKLVLIEQLVGIAVEAIAVENLRNILSEYEIDAAVLAGLQTDFERILARENFAMSFEGEKMLVYDEIQRCFTQDRFGGGHLYLTRIGTIADATAKTAEELIFETIFSPEGWGMAVKVLFFHPNKEQTREAADRFYAYCETFAQKTPAQIRAEGIDGQKETMKIVEDNVLLSILTPALGRAARIGHRHRTNVEATVTILALHRYKADKDSFPDDLQELISAGYLRQLPIDVYSGKPLVYRKTDESFILYSIGENFEDDGGKPDPNRKGRPRLWDDEGDSIFWPVPKPELKQ
jgi:hypothetical protein